ncbi:Flp pilus assembly complex ATPase component [bacterium]|nr:Flp pilus assembly complex ATPase component [bacterium]
MSQALPKTSKSSFGAELLDHTLIFGSLDAALKEQIFQLSVEKNVPAGQVIFNQGAPADGVYIVATGKVSILSQNKDLGLSLEIAVLGPGEVFGEMALITGEVRGAASRAREDSKLFFLSKETFDKLTTKLPSVSMGIAQTLARRLQTKNQKQSVEYKNLSSFTFDSEIYELVPDLVLRKHKAIPLLLDGNLLTVAMVTPEDSIARDEIMRGLRRLHLHPVAVSESDYQNFISNHLGKLRSVKPNVSLKRTVVDPSKVELINITEDFNKTKVVSGEDVIRLLNTLIAEALSNNASDIHIEAGLKGLTVRYRVDGILHERQNYVPGEYAAPMISRLKVLARLDPTEKLKPQDGRISMQYEKKDYDLRVATIPVRRGERVTMRILDSDSSLLNLNQLLLVPQVVKLVEQMSFKPQGLVLVTGPTGSGKTTSMYSLLKARIEHDGAKISVATIEDPIEYSIKGISQTEVNHVHGLNFSIALKSLLRHDPDVIMVGETRDAETAQTVCQAALTGHSVITSMHTNSAIESILRLEDLGVEKAMVVSALNGVIAQRLVRRNCTSCSRPSKLSANLRQSLVDSSLLKENDDFPVQQGEGCRACNGTGFQGRMGVYEILPMSESLKDVITRSSSRKEIQQEALRSNMVTMKSYAYFLLRKGLTSPSELLRLIS